ncbi:MAG: biopolymer transporter ExbD [Marinovum sp.]|nr:biopolymer transporter ExbD [Marinovum sp.]
MHRLGSRISDNDGRRAELDSSLAIVNIVLLLIFFFLATGSILASGEVKIALPDTSDLPLDMLPEPLLVINEDGSMQLNSTPIEPGTLAELTLDDPILHILADRDSNAQQVLEVIAKENLIAQEIRLVTLHRREETE